MCLLLSEKNGNVIRVTDRQLHRMYFFYDGCMEKQTDTDTHSRGHVISLVKLTNSNLKPMKQPINQCRGQSLVPPMPAQSDGARAPW